MRNKLLLIVFAALLTGCVTTSLLIEANPVGKVYRNSIQLLDKVVPLPEGEWKVIGRGAATGGNYFEIVLLKEGEKTGKMPPSIIITTNSPNNTYRGYVVCAYCERKDVHHIVVKNNKAGGAQDCWLINHYLMSMNVNRPAVKEAYDYFLTNKITIPKVLIQSFHHFTGKYSNSRYLEVVYFSNPELDGFEPSNDSSWGTSEWHPLRINNNSQKMAYIERLIKEGAIIHEKIRQGFEGQIIENIESTNNANKPEIKNAPSPEKLSQPSSLQGSTEVSATTPIPDSANTKDSFVIKDKNFNANGDVCGADVNIIEVSGGTIKKFNANSLIIGVRGEINLWCNGAKHTWIGKLTYSGYTFDSDKDDPLQFEVNEGKGYVYLKGRGKITQPDGSIVVFENQKDATQVDKVKKEPNSESVTFGGIIPSKPKSTIQSNLDVNLTWGCIAEAESYKIYWTSRKDGKLDRIRFLESKTCYVTHQTDSSMFPITYYVVAVKGTMESQPSEAAQAQFYSSENGKKCQLCGAQSVGYCHLRNIYVCSSHNTFTDRSGKRWQCP